MSIDDKISVLIPDGDSILTNHVVRCLAQQPRVKINILSKKRYAPIRFSRHINSYDHYASEYEDFDLSTIISILKKTNSNLVLPVDQPGIRAVIEMRSEIGRHSLIAPLPELQNFDISCDKWFSAEFFNNNNIPHPLSLNLADNNNLSNLESIKYPLLIKPKMGFYGRGIKKINNSDDLHHHIKDYNDIENYIAQEFIHGYDIDCSVLCLNGEIIVYTMQRGIIGGRPQFASAGGVEFIYNEEVFHIIKDLMDKLNWTGVAHIDLKYDEHDKCFKVLEINPRYWGTLIGSLNAGVNFPYLSCLTALGEKKFKQEYKFNCYLTPQYIFVLMKERYENKKKLKKYHFDTGFKYIFTDPLPEVIGVFQELRGQMKKRSNNSI